MKIPFHTILPLFLATLLWYQMFSLQILPFWISITMSTAILIIIPLFYTRTLWEKSEWNWANILWGVASAFILYAVFAVGNLMIRALIPAGGAGVDHVYQLKGSTPEWIIILTLIFPIGPGEEIFWRGFVQREWSRVYSSRTGIILSVLFYAAVHIPAGNPILVLAAGICGAFWSILLWMRRSIIPGIISHILWDILIFAVFPMH